jgi:tetratricopeptide (TPR) repeat protein
MTVEVIVGPTCIATQGRTPRFAENATNRGADYGADGTGNDQCLEVARTEMVACQAGRQPPAVVWYCPRDWSVRQEGVNLVNSIKHSLLIAVAILALLCGPASLARAQSSTADDLNKRFIELYRAGKFAEAVPLAQQALAIYEKALGPDHPDVAQALNNLATLYYNQGRTAEAEPLYKRSLAIREKALGPDHPDVAQALNNLALLYKQQGRYAEAEPLHKRSLAIREKALGPDHPDVAGSLNNLAALYDDQGRYAEAEPLYKRALAIREKALGPDHPDVAHSLNNLAALYDNQGRYAEVEPLYKRSLAIREKALGPDHPDVALALNNLAALYDKQGRTAEAEPLHKRALAVFEKALGPDHRDVATALNSLASLYDDQGRYAEAEPLLKRALAIYEKALGPDHPDVALSLNNLAALYDDQGRYAEAEPLYKRSLAIKEKALGPDHPAVARALNNLALLYKEQGRKADAEPVYKRALAIDEKALGPDHPDVAQSLNNLAALYDDQGRYAEAEPLYKRALAIREKALGPDHPAVALALNNLAALYRDQGRNAEAEPLDKRALAIYEKALGPDHPDVALALNNLAALYDDQGRYAEAESLYKRSLAIKEKALGPDHPAVALALNNLAALYDNQGRYADALPLVRRTIANKTAKTWPALPVLFGAQGAKLIAADEVIDDGLNVMQRASQTSAGEALNALAVRFAAGNDRLAQLVRKDQDLASEGDSLDKAILAAVSNEPSRRDAAAEQRIRDRIAVVAKERNDLQTVFAREFPDYAALSRPEPLTVKDIQPLLAADEALVVVDLGGNSYVWAITRRAADWKELAVSAPDISKAVSALRSELDFDDEKPFDTQASFALYQKILAPVEDMLRGKPRLSIVLTAALTSLPPQLLVTRDPTDKALKDVDWLVRTHAVTVLPSIASLKVLRRKSAVADAKKPLIGFANPVFDPDQQQPQQNAGVVAEVTASHGTRGGTVADISVLKAELKPLPDTANELRQVAANVKADPAHVILGPAATETRVKREKLDQFRIVYFATHGLLAGDVADFAKLNAEPALVLSLPKKPTEFDDGLLTASEVAQLKLNADWVVLSACNTASGDKPGAEALSGLARAFFYAGGRSLLVSNWEVETRSAVALMVGTFAALAANPKLSHGEALQKAMLAVIENTQHSEWADPKYWAPFVVVGEPAKPTH